MTRNHLRHVDFTIRPLRKMAGTPNASSHTLGLVVAIATLCALPLAASAADDDAGTHAARTDADENSLYLEYQVGYSYIPNQTIRGKGAAATTLQGRTEQEQNGNYFVGGAFGTKVGHGFRAEIAIGYRRSQLERIGVQPGPSRASNGHLALLSAMANVFYDLDLSDHGTSITPWIGAGIGWGMPFVKADNFSAAPSLTVDDTDSVFVYNAMAGVFFPLSDATGVNIGYRYIATDDIILSARLGGVPTLFDYEFDAHEAFVGLRFTF